MTDEKILDRIQKLLAMSRDTSSPHEAAIAAKRAASLMQKHNLEEADVILKDLGSDDITQEQPDTGGVKITGWMNRFSVAVAKLMDCEVRIYSDHRNHHRMVFLGQKQDAQVAAWIFTYLVDQVKRLAKKHRAGLRKKYGAGHGRNMGDYRNGVVDEILLTIQEMIRNQEEALKVHATGTALVVAKRDLIEQKYGKTNYGETKDRELRDPSNYLMGRKDGKSIKVNPALETSAQEKLA